MWTTKAQISLSTQSDQRLCLQADLRLCCSHMAKTGFLMTWLKFEPAHEIMVVFVLRKLILQRCMLSHPVGLNVWLFVGPFLYFHTSCVQTAKALARLCRCQGLPESSLVTYVISTIISWAGSILLWWQCGVNYSKPSNNSNTLIVQPPKIIEGSQF